MAKLSLRIALVSLVLCSLAAPLRADVTYVYDDLGRVTTVTYDDGKVITYTYDAAGNRTTEVASPVNHLPVAVADTASAVPNVAVTINVRANDSDPDGDPLTVAGTTTPTRGTASVVNNNVVYTTTNPTTGTDTFTYTISDGNGGSASAGITVAITGTNNAPVANPDSESVLDQLTITLDPRANDTDPNNDPLTVISVTNGTNGTVTIQSGGTWVTYSRTSALPFPGSSVTDSFNYTISDGQGGTATSTVDVTLEASPACGGEGQPVCP